MTSLEHQTVYETLDVLGLVLLHKFLGHLQLSQQRPEVAHPAEGCQSVGSGEVHTSACQGLLSKGPDQICL